MSGTKHLAKAAPVVQIVRALKYGTAQLLTVRLHITIYLVVCTWGSEMTQV